MEGDFLIPQVYANPDTERPETAMVGCHHSEKTKIVALRATTGGDRDETSQDAIAETCNVLGARRAFGLIGFGLWV